VTVVAVEKNKNTKLPNSTHRHQFDFFHLLVHFIFFFKEENE